MTSVAGSIRPQTRQVTVQPWLHSRRSDLTYLILSIILAGVPYAAYFLFGGSATEAASAKGTLAYNARLLVNGLVTFLVSGPHMYATFTRTVFDGQYRRRRRWFLLSTIAVPVVVISMAVWSYKSYVWLLSIFFAAASLHALYQILWLTEAYNVKARLAFTWRSRLIDYGLVVTSLYPIATYKMVSGQFVIGSVQLKYGQVIGGWYWLAALAALAFATCLVLFIAKTIGEWRRGYVNVPKTLLISLTSALTFFTPAFSNLDTAFQGINTWHSFQYLALTWYANSLRRQRSGQPVGSLQWPAFAAARHPRGILHGILGYLRRIDGGNGWTAFYLVCMAMLPISGLIYVGARLIWPNVHAGYPGADETYTYIAVLSILLIHYVQDGLLFTDWQSLVE
jgi:hypothetical protein